MSNTSAPLDTASIWDRLAKSHRPRSSSPQATVEMKQHVCRDLERLLNTRRRIAAFNGGVGAKDPLLLSLITYGLPDFAGAQMGLREERERFRLEVQRLVADFEPRVRNVKVEEIESTTMTRDRTMRFYISGILRSAPGGAGRLGRSRPEKLFETRIEPATCAVAVKSAR